MSMLVPCCLPLHVTEGGLSSGAISVFFGGGFQWAQQPAPMAGKSVDLHHGLHVEARLSLAE